MITNERTWKGKLVFALSNISNDCNSTDTETEYCRILLLIHRMPESNADLQKWDCVPASGVFEKDSVPLNQT